MSRHDLENELVSARAQLRLAQERLVVLETRDQERSKAIAKTRASMMAAIKNADRQTALRIEAEQNAARWHALLLQERVRQIPERSHA